MYTYTYIYTLCCCSKVHIYVGVYVCSCLSIVYGQYASVRAKRMCVYSACVHGCGEHLCVYKCASACVRFRPFACVLTE